MNSEKLSTEQMIEITKDKRKEGWHIYPQTSGSGPDGKVNVRDLIYENLEELITFFNQDKVVYIMFKKLDMTEKYRKEGNDTFIRIE